MMVIMTATNIIDIDTSIAKGAIFSEDRKYRYALWRIWNLHRPFLMQIGLNPSTANESIDDPTITRGIARAYKADFGGFLMANLYAFVSTDPKALLGNGKFEDTPNDSYIKRMVCMSSIQLCAWGSFPPVGKRAPIVYPMLTKPYCLGLNADGEPKHPLYVSYKVPMVEYDRAKYFPEIAPNPLTLSS